MELDIARWRSCSELRLLWLGAGACVQRATTIEVDGQFGGFSTAGEFFNVTAPSHFFLACLVWFLTVCIFFRKFGNLVAGFLGVPFPLLAMPVLL